MKNKKIDYVVISQDNFSLFNNISDSEKILSYSSMLINPNIENDFFISSIILLFFQLTQELYIPCVNKKPDALICLHDTVIKTKHETFPCKIGDVIIKGEKVPTISAEGALSFCRCNGVRILPNVLNYTLRRALFGKYIKNSFDENKLELLREIGSGSYGNVYKGEINNKIIAVKIMKNVKKEHVCNKLCNKLFGEDGNKNCLIRNARTWHEIYLLELIKPLIYNKICPNLPFLYHTYLHDNNKYIIMLLELANGTLNDYLKTKPNIHELYSCLFQIFAGLHTIQKHLQIMNFDVKKQNILVYNIKKGGVFQYTIRGKTFWIPNYGKLFILNDFGTSRTMSPKYPIYKTDKDMSYRLGSRYAVVYKGKFVPFNTGRYFNDKLEKIDAKEITWKEEREEKKSSGAEFRVLRINSENYQNTKGVELKAGGKILPIKIDIPKNIQKFLKKENIDINSENFFNNPEIIPPFEFYNDTQDAIRMFIGGKRTTQKGFHKVINTPKKLIKQLSYYNHSSESAKSGIFTTKVEQVLAGYFIIDFFTKYTNFSVKPNIPIIEKFVI